MLREQPDTLQHPKSSGHTTPDPQLPTPPGQKPGFFYTVTPLSSLYPDIRIYSAHAKPRHPILPPIPHPRHPPPRRRDGHPDTVPQPRHRDRLPRLRKLHRHPLPLPPRLNHPDPQRLPQRRRRRDHDQHLRRCRTHARRVRSPGPLFRAQQSRCRDCTRCRRQVLHQRATPICPRRHGPRNQTHLPRTDHLGHDVCIVPDRRPRIDRRRCRRHPHRNLPRSPPGQVRHRRHARRRTRRRNQPR